MKRDGACISLWQNDIGNYTSKTQELPTGIVDVVVVGGGITGLSTALQLQKAGKKCVIVEAYNIGFGTTAGTTAHINTVLDTPYTQIIQNFDQEGAQLVADATKKAIELIKHNIQEYAIECDFKEVEGFLFAQDQKQSDELEKILEATRSVGIDIYHTSAIPVPIPFEKAVNFRGQAQFHPLKYLYGLAEAFEKEGGMLLQNTRVEHVEEKGLIHINTSKGQLEAHSVVYATHIPLGVNVLHFRAAPYRSYAIAVKLKNGLYPDAEVYDMHDPYHYYRTQDIEGEKYLIAGGEDHKTAHEANAKFCFHNLENYIRSHFDVESVKFKWSSQYFESVDGLPYIGHLPGNPKTVYVATGYGGNGMVFSHVAALELTEKILLGRSRFNDLFDPSRIKLAGLGNFIKEQADVVAQFFGKWFSVKDLQALADLAPGDAKVVKYEGHSIALHKDDTGNFHAVSPTCTHVHCSVAWNNAEKSWDCPCHGARYSYDGKVLTGPASKDLEPISLKHE